MMQQDSLQPALIWLRERRTQHFRSGKKAGGDKYRQRKGAGICGHYGRRIFIDLTELVSLRKSAAKALLLLNDVLTEGKDVKQIMKDWVSFITAVFSSQSLLTMEDMLNMSAENSRGFRTEPPSIGGRR